MSIPENLTIYEQDTRRGLWYMWEEFNGGWGSGEIITNLYNYILLSVVRTVIENASEHRTISVPQDCQWYNGIKSAIRKDPYHITPVEYSDIIDFKQVHKGYQNLKKDT